MRPASPTANQGSSTTPLGIGDIRGFLRDYTQNNILLDDVQFNQDDMERAIDFAVDEFNVMTPISAMDAFSIPKSILLLGAASWLMRSESFLQIRNQASYQDGDIAPIGLDDKHQLYVQASRALKEEWQTSARAYKQQQNIESAYGRLSSGYANVGRYYNS